MQAATRSIDRRLIGKSPAMAQLKQEIQRLAGLEVTVLIEGPSGSGKELVADLIHAYSPRREHPWVAINCGAIPDDLFESELFGHRAGAFTGAANHKKGLLAVANQSTLFLDEIGELPKKMQVKLLRALETDLIRPLGSTEERPLNARVIAATNQPIDQLVADGQFRLDLYHRLKVTHIQTPALSDLVEDLAVLSAHLLSNAAARFDLPRKALSDAALQALKHHPFPGNVRELDHCLTRGLIRSTQDVIEYSDLGLAPLRDRVVANASATPALEPASRPPTQLLEALNTTESALISQALKDNAYQRHAAALQLGITERALRYRLKKHGL
jgi:two-component system response regulator PilR (NtrC family)